MTTKNPPPEAAPDRKAPRGGHEMKPRLSLAEMARLERKRANMERDVHRLKPNSGARERAARRLVDFILGEWGQAFGTDEGTK